MRFALTLFASLLLNCTLLAQTPAANTTAEAAARVPLEIYLKAHATGDGTHLRQAFLPTAHIEGIRNDKFTSWTVNEYAANFSGKPSPEEPQRKRWIEKLEVTGTAAIATLRFDYPKVKITDYMVLIKDNGEWKIANKVYASQPK